MKRISDGLYELRMGLPVEESATVLVCPLCKGEVDRTDDTPDPLAFLLPILAHAQCSSVAGKQTGPRCGGKRR